MYRVHELRSGQRRPWLQLNEQEEVSELRRNRHERHTRSLNSGSANVALRAGRSSCTSIIIKRASQQEGNSTRTRPHGSDGPGRASLALRASRSSCMLN